MGAIYEDKLLEISNKLDPILKTLACIKETMEQTGPSVLVDDYFNILVAFERINEAKERLGKIAEKQKQEGRTEEGIMVNITEIAKEVGMKFSTTLASAVSMEWIKR